MPIAPPTLPGVTTRFAGEDGVFLWMVEATEATARDPGWFAANRDALLQALDHYGAVYFRGFDPDSHGFESILDVLAPTTMPYGGGVSPRRFVHGTIFTANDAPGPLPVSQHHELAYHGSTPRYVAFYCDHPCEEGGATPVADGRRFGRLMYERFPEVIDKLEEQGVIYIRNYSAANHKSWQETWQTKDLQVLEQRLEDNHAEYEWLADDWLRTVQRRPAVIRDPVSGERILYATLNIWSRPFVERVSRVYAHLDAPPEDDWALPFNTLFGDGTPIPRAFVETLESLYGEEMVVVPYLERDFMVVNNFVASHGRTPWKGIERRVFVTMREPIHCSELREVPPRAA